MSHMRSRSSNITVVQSVTPALRGGAAEDSLRSFDLFNNAAVDQEKIAEETQLVHACKAHEQILPLRQTQG